MLPKLVYVFAYAMQKMVFDGHINFSIEMLNCRFINICIYILFNDLHKTNKNVS